LDVENAFDTAWHNGIIYKVSGLDLDPAYNTEIIKPLSTPKKHQDPFWKSSVKTCGTYGRYTSG